MPSKLKQRRLRRLHADVAWWRAEAQDLHARVMEQADEIEALRRQVYRVPMPVLVPAQIINLLNKAATPPTICIKCNDGVRGGCSSCSFNVS